MISTNSIIFFSVSRDLNSWSVHISWIIFKSAHSYHLVKIEDKLAPICTWGYCLSPIIFFSVSENFNSWSARLRNALIGWIILKLARLDYLVEIEDKLAPICTGECCLSMIIFFLVSRDFSSWSVQLCNALISWITLKLARLDYLVEIEDKLALICTGECFPWSFSF